MAAMINRREGIRRNKFCKECCTWFNNKSNLNAHIKARHNLAENVEGFPCPRCEKIYRQKRSLKTHFLAKHSNSEEEWRAVSMTIHPIPIPNKSIYRFIGFKLNNNIDAYQ